MLIVTLFFHIVFMWKNNVANNVIHLWIVHLWIDYFFPQDDFPLASLPLLGYAVTTPTEADAIHKEYVFKLQFKNHVYFFRAESEYTFER